MDEKKVSNETKFANNYTGEESHFVRPPQADDGETKSYNIVETLYYPHLMLLAESIPNYRMRVLRNALENLEYGHNHVLENYYDVYLKLPTMTLALGMVHSDNLRSILQGAIFKPLDKYIMLDTKTKIVGSMMLSLCTSQRY